MTTLTHAQRDIRDEVYMDALRDILPVPCQHERGRLIRENLVRHYPQFREMFAALPLLHITDHKYVTSIVISSLKKVYDLPNHNQLCQPK